MNPPRQSDLALRLAQGDQQAWYEVYDTHAGSVWRWTARLLRTHQQDVADVVQEILLAAARSARQYDPDRGTLSQWLFGITRKQVALHQRRSSQPARVKHADPVEINQSTPLDPNRFPEPEELLLKQELASQVREVLGELSDEYTRLLLDFYLDEVSVEVLAEELGSTPTAVRSKLARARNAFREVYERRVALSSVTPPEESQ